MSFNLEGAINEYAKRISVTHSLDPAIREEFASHLREKVDYYLGKRQLTAEEAFRLAVQTIGDPETFVPALQQVHAGRRIADQSIGLFDAGVLVLAAYETPSVIMEFIGSITSYIAPNIMQHALKTPVFIAVRVLVCVLCAWLAYKFVVVLRTRSEGKSGLFLTRLSSLGLRMSLVVWLCAAVLIHIGQIGYYNIIRLVPVVPPIHRFPQRHEIADFVYAFVSCYVILALFVGLLAYLACRVVSLDDRRPFHAARAAFVPVAALLAFKAGLLAISFASHVLLGLALGVGIGPYSTTMGSGVFVAGSLRMLAVSAVSCALGWLAFELQQRSRRSASV
jgi:hypothetical protein